MPEDDPTLTSKFELEVIEEPPSQKDFEEKLQENLNLIDGDPSEKYELLK